MFEILSVAWEKGIRYFDTASGYGSEHILGEFIRAHGIEAVILVSTKIPPIKPSKHFKTDLRGYVVDSVEKLGCPIDVLFFHQSANSTCLIEDTQFYEELMSDIKRIIENL